MNKKNNFSDILLELSDYVPYPLPSLPPPPPPPLPPLPPQKLLLPVEALAPLGFVNGSKSD